MDRVKKHTKQVVVGIVGGFIVLVGIVAIPYPGPGWLIVFSGLAILSIEFEWAKRILHFGRDKYEAWKNWITRQNSVVQGAVLSVTCAVVVMTLWLFNAYGYMNHWLGLGQEWMASPIPWF